MLPVYICEDEPILLKTYTDYILDFLSFRNYEMKVVCSTVDPKEILNAVRNNRQKGIYFLDIEFGTGMEKEGLYLGAKIREYDSDGYIVYISSHTEKSMMILNLRITATDFIDKGNAETLKKRIGEVLDSIYERDTLKLPDEKTLKFKTRAEQTYLKQSDIYYIEVVPGGRKIAIHTQNCIYEIGESLKSIASQLGDNFVYCHKSIIVNTEHIKAIQKNERKILFDNNAFCDTSARLLKSISKIMDS